MNDPKLAMLKRTIFHGEQQRELREEYHAKYQEALSEQQAVRSVLRRDAAAALGKHTWYDHVASFSKDERVTMTYCSDGIEIYIGGEAYLASRVMAEAVVMAYLLLQGLDAETARLGSEL